MHQKKAVIYARVSTTRQAEDELSLDSQIDQCRRKAEALGARVDRVFVDEGLSGRSDNRAQFQAAIQFCELTTPDYLITWSTSRFSRNKIDAGLYKMRLERAGVEITYVSINIDRETDAGWMTEGILELFDEFHSRQIAADTTRSMMRNAAQGFFNGGRPPYGFQVVEAPDNPKRKRLAVQPIEAMTVREIFRMRLDGRGGRAIAVILNDRGIHNRKGKWSKATVSALLRNHAVIGKSVFNRKSKNGGKNPREQWVIVDSHESIIDHDTWAQVQGMMDDAVTNSSGSPKSTWVFTGILQCSSGSSMQITSGTSRNGDKYYYYQCRDHIVKGEGGSRSMRADLFDAWMIGQILDRVLTREFLLELAEHMNESSSSWEKDRNERRQAVAGQLQILHNRNEKLFSILELHGKDAPNLGDMTSRLQANNTEIRRLERVLEEIDREQAPDITIAGSDIDELAATLRYIIESTDNPKKLRTFFSSFIDRIVVWDDSVRIDYRPECLMTIREPVPVPSERDWLPEPSLLGTAAVRSLTVQLPDQFWRKAA